MADIKRVSFGLREAERLALLKSYQVVDAEPVGFFDDVASLAAHTCAAPIATLAFFETRRQWFKSRIGVEVAEGPLEGSLNGYALQRNENLFVVDDIAADPRFARDPVVQANPGVRFYAGALLTMQDGLPVGVLSVLDHALRPGGLNGQQIEALLALAGSVVRELEARRSGIRKPEPQGRDFLLAGRATLTREMTATQLQKALLVTKTIPWELSLPTGRLVLGEYARELLGLGAAVAMSRFRDHIHEDDQEAFDAALRDAAAGASCVVEVRFKRTRGRQSWLRLQAAMVSHFSVAGTLVDITAKKKEDEAGEPPRTDPLTGLMSRGAFQRALQTQVKSARASRKKFAAFIIDLDNLEEVNGALGQYAGDEVLRQAASRLTALIGERGKVGRGRDDEFVAYVRDVATLAEVEEFGSRLLASLREEFTFEGASLSAQSSIGAAVFLDPHRDLTRLLQGADAALRVAKSAGRDRVEIFSSRNIREADRKAREAQALSAGVARGDVLPFYQPLFDLATGDVIGFEALARWRHPSKGVLAANFFQSAFSDSDTASDITEAMIKCIAADLKTWAGEKAPDAPISLNIAESELRRPEAADRILACLASVNLAPEAIIIEASEGVIGRSAPGVIKTLASLRGAGVRICIDNFGKAGASLSVLRAVQVDRLKIDRSVIAAVDSSAACAAIVASLVTLSQRLKIDVVAEGVETIGQLELLRSIGCPSVQGYLLGAPMVGSRIPEFVRRLRQAKSLGHDPYALVDAPDPFGLPNSNT